MCTSFVGLVRGGEQATVAGLGLGVRPRLQAHSGVLLRSETVQLGFYTAARESHADTCSRRIRSYRHTVRSETPTRAAACSQESPHERNSA